MTWIKTIPYQESEGALRKIYDRVKSKDGLIDNILVGHSLRPHTLRGHMELYKSVLHHSGNQLSKWYLESIGVYVSMLNGCHYCIEHHAEGLRKLLDNDTMYYAIFESLQTGYLGSYFDGKQMAGFRYAKSLTQNPQTLESSHIEKLLDSGFDDGEILELNQVVSYFNYANRMVLGLGITTEGDELGTSPGGDDDSWEHK